MPRHFTADLHFDAPPARLAALFTHPAFLEAEARLQGAFRATCTDLERTSTRVHLRLTQVGPNRDPRSRDKEATTTLDYDWDLTVPGCRWRREAEKADGIDVRGAHRIHPEGTGCRYALSWDVAVDLPLVGRVFEKKLEEGILEAMRKREAFVRDWLRRDGPG